MSIKCFAIQKLLFHLSFITVPPAVAGETVLKLHMRAWGSWENWRLAWDWPTSRGSRTRPIGEAKSLALPPVPRASDAQRFPVVGKPVLLSYPVG